MTKKDPAFLFYSSNFLSGCSDLTMEERGQYITMLALQHQKGKLNEKTIRLCVGNISLDVRNKFETDENGNLYNEKLQEIIEERKKFTESRSMNGSKGGRPKKDKKPSGLPSEKPSENLPKDININKDINITPESNETNLIIKKYENYFKKSYRLSFNERMSICMITNDEQYSLEDWDIIFKNASKGWNINNQNVKPSLSNILENYSKFLNDDYNLGTQSKQKGITQQQIEDFINEKN